jgi:2-polyprenyl-3-methyl-5-hydroxy-6-metoxy-1,4-benzoquinol methylase
MLMQSGHRVLGIELNAAMAAEARSLGVEVIEHDVEEGLPIPDSCMDVVHACEIIEHLFDTEGFLKDVRRVLRPHGALIVSTPNLNSLINRFSVLRGKPLRMWGAFPGDLHGSHIRVLNKAKMLQLLARTGFRADSIIGVNQSRASARLLDRLPTFSELILIRAVPTEGGHS